MLDTLTDVLWGAGFHLQQWSACCACPWCAPNRCVFACASVCESGVLCISGSGSLLVHQARSPAPAGPVSFCLLILLALVYNTHQADGYVPKE